MSFLSWLLKTVLEFIANFFWGKLKDYEKAKEAQDEERKRIEEKNKKVADKNEQAETPEEREDAAGDIFKNFDDN